MTAYIPTDPFRRQTTVSLYDVSPLRLAEDIPINLLLQRRQDALDDEASAPTVLKSIFKRYIVAAADLEVALSPDTVLAEQEALLDESDAILTEIKDAAVPLGSSLTARLLSTYFPAFEARSKNEEPSADDIDDIALDLASLVDTTLRVPRHTIQGHDQLCDEGHPICVSSEKQRRKLLHRLGMHALMLRNDMIIYPTTPRESIQDLDINVPSTQQFVHDGYVVYDTGKIPIRLVSDAQYDGPTEILPLAYAPMIERSRLATGRNYGDTLPKTASNEHFEWIVQDARGDNLSRQPRRLLDSASNQLEKRIIHYRQGKE